MECVNTELPLFQNIFPTEDQNNVVTSEEILIATNDSLKNYSPTNPIVENKVIKTALDKMFPEQQYEEKEIRNVKSILGEASKNYSAEELNSIMSEIQFLVTSWLDEYERKYFEGRTLRELLHEKGGL